MADSIKAKGRLRPKTLKQDDSIMGTNNSSIVSKRSVERLYYPDEPHFFRYFVKKPQRRAPLINRGYWLRMKAIDHVVSQFLNETLEKKKIVINLGCGYDPLPWQSWTRYPEASKDVTFVDIDYRDLILRKRDMVRQTTELNDVLRNLEFPEDGDILLRSEQYLQIGCDLRDLTKLEKVLTSEFDLDKCVVFCTAEVSIAYMDVDTSDALIKWIGSLPDARFCLLEQLLPSGPDHPFAKTMLAHFDKLQTPLRPVLRYPTTGDQENRFKNAGWAGAVRARNLWNLWGSSDFLSSEDRMRLDNVEPFDEWEEFALFGCHYTLLEAANRVPTTSQLQDLVSPAMRVMPAAEIGFPVEDHSIPDAMPTDFIRNIKPSNPGHGNPDPTPLKGKMIYTEYPKTGGIRRFAAPLSIKGPKGRPDLKGNFAGMGLNTRLQSIDVFTVSPEEGLFHQRPIEIMPPSRMCHTLTEIGDAGSLLVGGRTSPDNSLADCWLYSKLSNTWERVDDIPIPRYRHSAVAVGNGYVLVTGGKKDSKTVLSDTFLWNRQTGWIKCPHDTSNTFANGEPQVFGAVMVSNFAIKGSSREGFLVGGLSADGCISTDLWSWEFCPEHGISTCEPSIRWTRNNRYTSTTGLYLHRFGASSTNCDGQLLVVGGIASDDLIPECAEIVALDIDNKTGHLVTRLTELERHSIRPLLVGHSVATSGRSLLIMGGGAVCFSFGTFWNKGCYTVSFDRETNFYLQRFDKVLAVTPEPWKYLKTIEVELVSKAEILAPTAMAQQEKAREPVVVRRKKLSSSSDFTSVLAAAEPVILEGLDLGSCTELWTNAYLLDRIGRDRQVIVHQATSNHMDFISKNFEYATKTFGDFIEAIGRDEKLYLRSLAVDKPSELPADLSRDFPTISQDFHLPPDLAVVNENKHSSPLRISGPVTMWLHYDVMSNVLCQIRGKKRLLLFPPSDVQYFDFSPGSSSSSIDAFEELGCSRLAATHPHEVILYPGDVLFIPSLWLHTARPLDGISVSVNVFFRGLQNGYAAGKDVYGNRDLQAYEKGRRDVAKIGNMFNNLPPDIRKFYLLRLAEELSTKARSA